MLAAASKQAAAVRISRVARGASARRATATRRQRAAAAVVLQRWLLRWLRVRGRGHSGLVTQVVLLRLLPAEAAGALPAAAVLASSADLRLGEDGHVSPPSLAPFASLSLFAG